MSQKSLVSNVFQSDSLASSSSLENPSSPYLGLKSFEHNGIDSHVFFGRDTLIEKLVNNLQENNFLAILGSSGSGKSSLLQAGLLHYLYCFQERDIQLIHPGQHPLNSLAMTFLDPHLPILQKAEQIAEIELILQQSPDGFSRFLGGLSTPKLVLAIDNFEEIFTLCQNPRERWQFLTSLLTALQENPQKLTIIAIINDQFWGDCLEQEPRKFGEKIQENFCFISPLDHQERYEAIILPAIQANLTLEPELIEKLLKDTQQLKGSLPLLQYTLWQLYRLRTDSTLTLASYQQLGGVRKVLEWQATQIFQQLTRLQRKTAQKLFLSLIQTDEEMRYTCHQVPQRQLETLPDFPLVLQKFKQAGLIQTQEKDTIAHREILLQLAHPIMIQHWGFLQQWLEERHYFLRQEKNLEDAAQQWQIFKRDKKYLLTGDRLKNIKNLQKNQTDFSSLTQEFLRQSFKIKSQKTLLYVILPVATVTFLCLFIYRHWEIKKAWHTLEEVKNNLYDDRRRQALERLNFWQINLKEIPLAYTYLKNINLSRANLANMDFSGTTLEKANLSHTNLMKTNFESANLANSRLVKSNLSHSKLLSSNLIQSNLTEANLIQTNLDFSSLNFANLSSANLSQSSLYLANLEGANLLQTNLSSSNLYGANLAFSNLSFANLSHSNLSFANLAKANLLSTDLNNTNLLEANLIQVKNLDPTRLKQACFWQYANYKGQWNSQNKKWEIDKTANQQFIEKLSKDTASEPAIKPTCKL